MKKVRGTDSADHASNAGTDSREAAQKIARLLLVCADGVRKAVPEKHSLHPHLEELCQALRKTVPEGTETSLRLADELAAYFRDKKTEEKCRDLEKGEFKDAVLGLTQTIKELADASGGFDKNLDRQIKKIQDSDSAKDILVIKDQIVTEAGKAQSEIVSLKDELEKYKHIANDLTLRLKQSEAKALIDPLTQVFNRNAYNLKIKQTVKEFERYKDPSTLIVADIDFFKRFNDTYGHRAGDKILRFVAATIEKTIRKTDQVFRYGGEELVLLLHKIDMENSVKLAEKVRQNVEDGSVTFEGQELRVTISLGATPFKENDTEATIFQRADAAMYRAKNKGRNRVEAIF
ncbi:MAG: GGDEF domain-containing protein [Nitrospinales bacterium]